MLAAAGLLIVATIPIAGRLGAEFMPPLDEGTLFYMPTTMPGISIGDAQRLLQATDRAIKQFPEVDRVLGKAGRAETATDPAPLSMLETVITLKPRSEWRKVPTWYSSWAPAVDSAAVPAGDERSHLAGTARRRAGQGADAARRLERLDDAREGAHRDARDGHPHARRA